MIPMKVMSVFTFLLAIGVSECSPASLSSKINSNVELDGLLQSETMHDIHYTASYFSEAQEDTENVSKTKINGFTSDVLIPDYYKVVFTINVDSKIPSPKVPHILCSVVAKHLNLPDEGVKVASYNVSAGIIKLYFAYKPTHGHDSDLPILSPAYQIMEHLSITELQNVMNGIHIISIQPSKETVYEKSYIGKTALRSNVFNSHLKSWHLIVIISLCLFAVFCLFLFILFMSTRSIKKQCISAVGESRHVIFQPVLKPVVSGVDAVQPENKDTYITETDSEHTLSPSRSPLRLKSKGLLERRGSNASLTLDLNHSQENVNCATPPKECSTEEYLLSAGNQMTRKQLHACLKDVRTLYTEFWEIPMNHPEKVEIPGCGTKNRYKTILPNESTRVHLKDLENYYEPLSSYINANYIKGYNGEHNAYIATQGVMAHTINDFWLMVWSEKSPIIVMITKLRENHKVKCEPYVPDHQGLFGDIEVIVLKIILRDGYSVRELLLKKGREKHSLYHFWYTSWPDHKTPETAKQLLSMVMEVEALRHDAIGKAKGPTIVHCSAGIGRTGCFIAVSIGIQQLVKENVVDVLGIVCSLRLDRGGMVQTAEQYAFVHQALSVFEQAMADQSGE